MWVNGEGDENHVFVVDLYNDSIAMNKWGCVGRWLVHMSKFTTFVALTIVICIGSYNI